MPFLVDFEALPGLAADALVVFLVVFLAAVVSFSGLGLAVLAGGSVLAAAFLVAFLTAFSLGAAVSGLAGLDDLALAALVVSGFSVSSSSRLPPRLGSRSLQSGAISSRIARTRVECLEAL